MKIDRTISFRQDMIDLILAGKKTVTIRPIKQNMEQFFFGYHNFYTWNGDHELRKDDWVIEQCPYGKVCNIIPVKDQAGVFLDVNSVWFSKLRNIPDQKWKRDGLSDLSELSQLRHWNSFYGGTEYEWVKNPWVWIIEFELVRKGQNNENKGFFEET